MTSITFSLFSLRLQERALLHNLFKKIIYVRTAYETNVWQKMKSIFESQKGIIKMVFPQEEDCLMASSKQIISEKKRIYKVSRFYKFYSSQGYVST